MGIVAGLDSSADHTRIIVCDADTGAVVKQGYAEHSGERDDPQSWLISLGKAASTGQLADVQAIGVSAQQQGLIAMDATGAPVRPALLGNDKRMQTSAADLADALGGREAWAQAVGAVPQAAHPVSKLRWMARNEPEAAARVAELMQPHDWLVWQLLGRPARRTTDRGDASGTGYWSAAMESYRPDLIELALGHQVRVPEVVGPADSAGSTPEGLLISAGTGETMAAAFGLGVGIGDAVISLGASGSVFAVHHEALVDPSGTITSYADATGMHLPAVRTLNATRVLRGTAELLGTDLDGLSELALRSTPGAYGMVLLPYLEGELTPQLPHTAGSLHGMRRESMKPEHLARAAVEGMLCGLADALDVLRGRGVQVRRVFLLGQAAGLAAVREAAPALFGAQVVVPQPADYTALGAARQAAWALSGGGQPPQWPAAAAETFEPGEELPVGQAVRQQYVTVREQTHPGAFGPGPVVGQAREQHGPGQQQVPDQRMPGHPGETGGAYDGTYGGTYGGGV
ncbi:FGGY family carbohydrate kinase [Streptomyces sp. NPDC054796]